MSSVMPVWTMLPRRPSRSLCKKIILPTEQLVRELEQYETVLSLVGVMVEELVEYTVQSWLLVDAAYEQGHVHYLRPLTIHDVLRDHMHQDLIEGMLFLRLDPDDQHAVVRVSMEICNVSYRFLYPYLHDLFDKIGVNRATCIKECTWLGRDFVIEVEL